MGYHDEFLRVLREEIQKRPVAADAEYVKAGCKDSTFKDGYQHGISMGLSILAQSTRQYHEEGLSEKYKREDRFSLRLTNIPELRIPKTEQEMLDPKIGAKGTGIFGR